MGEKFIFDVPASVTAIDNILMIAEKIKDQDDFSGKLAKKLYELSFEINSESFVKNLNNTLETCRNYGGLNIERAWDGGGDLLKEMMFFDYIDLLFIWSSI